MPLVANDRFLVMVICQAPGHRNNWHYHLVDKSWGVALALVSIGSSRVESVVPGTGDVTRPGSGICGTGARPRAWPTSTSSGADARRRLAAGCSMDERGTNPQIGVTQESNCCGSRKKPRNGTAYAGFDYEVHSIAIAGDC